MLHTGTRTCYRRAKANGLWDDAGGAPLTVGANLGTKCATYGPTKIDGDEMRRRAGTRTLTRCQRRGRLPGLLFDVRPSGIEPGRRAPAPTLLGRRAIVLGQIRRRFG